MGKYRRRCQIAFCEYTGGKLYNPSEGDTYSLKAKLKSADELHFRGYLGISLLGKTMKFKRIK
ncbi:DUF2147 domain-containing protein [Chitinophaga sp. XS-30]|uniref:DUF2147 domain-containing protein n=1 Tax=Chitinophaga sp. XS-30 TaxID=2604421 RepID=UPI0011DCEC31|nr:DUF2147 domain-containing protein [Chitinophaga sp. XS-30]